MVPSRVRKDWDAFFLFLPWSQALGMDWKNKIENTKNGKEIPTNLVGFLQGVELLLL